MRKYFLQKQWYRNLFSNRTFYQNAQDEWKDLKDHRKGEYIKTIDGKWNVQFFCDNCQNELVHSKSFKKEYEVGGRCIYYYECSCCYYVQHGRPDIAPGIHVCKSDGNLVSNSSKETAWVCYEIHRPNIPDNGCREQCQECSDKQKLK